MATDEFELELLAENERLAKTVEQITEENHQLRELARDWCEAFETSNVKAVPDLIHRTKELEL